MNNNQQTGAGPSEARDIRALITGFASGGAVSEEAHAILAGYEWPGGALEMEAMVSASLALHGEVNATSAREWIDQRRRRRARKSVDERLAERVSGKTVASVDRRLAARRGVEVPSDDATPAPRQRGTTNDEA